jgi:molybdenum cofactor synthesis domain-containing protein
MNKKLEIICVGKELLMGKIPNVNAHWLAKRATTLGLEVDRIVTVTDDVDAVSTAVREAVQRKPRFIITTGGLGPTYDDKTLEGIAKGIGRDLELNEEGLKKIMVRMREHTQGRESEFGEAALKRIKQAVDDFERGVRSPYMARYATVPKGANVVLPPDIHSGGMGVICELDDITLITLPGVPQEVNAIVEQWIVPLFKEAAGKIAFFEASLDVKGIWERALAPLIDKVLAENPRVYVKSNVRSDIIREGLELYLSTTDEDPKIAENNLNKALNEISELILQNGGKITPIKAPTQS